MFPSAVFAGDVYSSGVTANFKVSLSNTVRPKGNATITCDGSNWKVTLNMRGLLKNYSEYLFQFSLYDQLIYYYDCPLPSTDKKGNLVCYFNVSGVDAKLPNPVGYNIVRIIDKLGTSGGQRISSVDQATVGDYPYRENGTILIRAREDCLGGCLVFPTTP